MSKNTKKPLIIDFDAVARLKHARARRGGPSLHSRWNNFVFSPCYTDWKDGQEIRRRFREEDYLNDEPYRSRLRSMLDILGLPTPSTVHRGTYHDLFFIKSHGSLLRAGTADMWATLNPGMLQPIGWLEDTKLEFSLVLMGGIELGRETDLSCLKKTILDCGNSPSEVNNDNVGYLKAGNAKKPKKLPLLLDVDNFINYPTKEKQKIGEVEYTQRLIEFSGLTIADMVSGSMHELFNDRAPREYLDAQRQHDGLRYLFSRAFSSPHVEQCTVDPYWRAAFWSAMRRATLGPLTLPAPRWRVEEKEDHRLLTVREETVTTQLYTPWTKKRQP